MKTLLDGPNVDLKQDGDTLILDVRWGGRITRDQIKLIESKGMVEAENDTWYGDAKARPEVEALVKLINQPWASREEERRAFQAMVGGR